MTTLQNGQTHSSNSSLSTINDYIIGLFRNFCEIFQNRNYMQHVWKVTTVSDTSQSTERLEQSLRTFH